MNTESTGIERVRELLSGMLGDRLQSSAAMREHHCNGTTWVSPQMPEMVAFPTSTAEVSEIVKICAERNVPIIPYGAGSSLEGHVNAPVGGVTLDMSNMSDILEVSPHDLVAVVQPGLTRKRLNEELRATGLHFPIDPGADASIGGMVATRASGTNAVRYGTMSDNILALECVMADGSIVRTGSRAKKSAAGYDLTRLIAGSEGTLAIITEIVIKLQGIPEHVIAGYAQFSSMQDVSLTVSEAIQSGVDVGRLELLDPAQIKACNAYSNLDLAEKPSLFFEFSGSKVKSEDDLRQFREIASDHTLELIESAQDADERNRLWTARHDAYWAALAQLPGLKGIVSDACVPISRLAECIEGAQADLRDLELDGFILGHVGDGNFHVISGVDPDDEDSKERAEELLDRISLRALAMGGTCTGEHGIGQGKIKQLAFEADTSIPVMKAIKTAMDSKNLLNPAKLF